MKFRELLPSGRAVSPTRVLGLALALGVACAMPAAAAEDSSAAPADTTAGAGSVLFPVLGYTPETGLLGGVTYLKFFQLGAEGEGSRPASVTPVAIVTANKQVMFLVNADLYWGQGRDHATITPQYTRFPEQFYGIGRDTRESDEEDYTPEQISLDLLYEKKFLDHLAGGLVFRFSKHRLIETEAGGQLDQGGITGTENTTLAAPGLRLAFDSRDNTWSARAGNFLQAATVFYREGLGSDCRFTEYMLDLRHYRDLGGSGSVAFQVMAKVQDGQPPFYVLPRLGGFEGLRGYISSRYPDQARLFGRAEWRSREFWKGLGGAVFAGYGDVAPAFDKLTTSAHLYTYGLGLRYTLNRQQQVKIRVDMGFGNGDSGFYFSLGEAF